VQFNISTRHGHLSPQSQEKIQDKIAKLTRFHERLTAVEVTIDLENEERPELEIQVTAERAGRFVASGAGEQLMPLVDAVVQKLEQQLRKHKEKVTDRYRQGSRHVPAEPEAGAEAE
jgi:putative sigma-54 modulation protein